jgi:hypothetical protein
MRTHTLRIKKACERIKSEDSKIDLFRFFTFRFLLIVR